MKGYVEISEKGVIFLHLSIHKKQEKDGVIATVSGEIDVHTASDLRDALMAVAVEKDQVLTVDLAKTTYIDSTGLGVFIGVFKALHKNGGTLMLTGMSERVQRLFTITGLSELIAMKQEKKEEST